MTHAALLRELENLAQEKGALLRHAAAIRPENKAGHANFVTQYDRRMQTELFCGCRRLVPDALLVGEEDAAEDAAAQVAPLPRAADAARCFVIDPIDGTANFIRGCRHSAVSIGYLEGGVVQVAVIYDPFSDECFGAYRGGGAWLKGKQLHTADIPREDGLFCFGSSPYYPALQAATLALLQKAMTTVGDVRRSGSAALDLAYLAAGRFDAFCELRLSPWDYAAGSLLVTEAGGVITQPDGAPLRFDAPCGVVAGANATWAQWLRGLV